MPNHKGPVYQHFEESGDCVACKYCEKTYKKSTASSSTKSLWYHLKANHQIMQEKPAESPSPAPKRKKDNQNLITTCTYNHRKSKQEMYAQLACEDRLSFNQIAKSQFIQSAMRDKLLIAHTSPTTIRDKVKEFHSSAKEDVKSEFTVYHEV